MVFLMPGPEEGYVRVLKEFCADGAGEGRVKGETGEAVLRKGFAASPSSNSGGSSSKWDTLTTDFQLELERWLLSSPRHLDMARKAYISHVRAYATHVAQERAMFDVKALHLGHLAKAFGLRERPGNFGRGDGRRAPHGSSGARHKGGNGVGSSRSRRGAKGDDVDEGVGVSTEGMHDDLPLTASDSAEAARKMRAKVKESMGKGMAAAEFNIG